MTGFDPGPLRPERATSLGRAVMPLQDSAFGIGVHRSRMASCRPAGSRLNLAGMRSDRDSLGSVVPPRRRTWVSAVRVVGGPCARGGQWATRELSHARVCVGHPSSSAHSTQRSCQGGSPSECRRQGARQRSCPRAGSRHGPSEVGSVFFAGAEVQDVGPAGTVRVDARENPTPRSSSECSPAEDARSHGDRVQ